MSHWRAVQGLDNSEEKAERIIKDQDYYRTPIRVQPAVEEMSRSFNNYEAFK